MFTIPSEYYLKIFVNKQVLFDGLKVNMIDKDISKHPYLCIPPPPIHDLLLGENIKIFGDTFRVFEFVRK